MKILPLVNGIKNDINISSKRLKNATLEGYNIGSRTAKVYNQNSFRKYLNITRSVGNKVVKGTTKEELPYLAGAIGMLLPLPLMSPIMLGIGFILRFSISDESFTNDTKLRDKK